MDNLPGRLTWSASENGGLYGAIHTDAHGLKARTRLFTVRLSVHPTDRANGTPWILAHRLPFQPFPDRFSSQKDAQRYAERWLVVAMRMLGFQPIPPEVQK